ncbi:hypothetical protein D9M68_955660 [compost metagenome]
MATGAPRLGPKPPLQTRPMVAPSASTISAPSRTGTRSWGNRPTRLLGTPSRCWAKTRSAPGKPPARAPSARRALEMAQVRLASIGVVALLMSWP